MIQELLYTSAPRGLKPGSRGFCTVLSTSGMPAPVATALESLSGYRPVFPPGDVNANLNPIVYSHLKLSLAGRRSDVLSRIADHGLDYSQRTNKIAHHVVIDSDSRPEAGPAWLMKQPGVMRTNWEGEPRLVSGERHLPQGIARPEVCTTWQKLAGDAGWAGVLAEAFLKNPETPSYLIVSPGMDVLSLIEEALALLPASRRWDVTFSTYFTKIPNGTVCQWRCVLSNSPEANESRRYVQSLRIDLTGQLGKATGGVLVEAARTGRMPATTSSASSERTEDRVVEAAIPALPSTTAAPPRPGLPQMPSLAPRSHSIRPPEPSRRRRPGRWSALFVLLLLAMASGAAAFKRAELTELVRRLSPVSQARVEPRQKVTSEELTSKDNESTSSSPIALAEGSTPEPQTVPKSTLNSLPEKPSAKPEEMSASVSNEPVGIPAEKMNAGDATPTAPAPSPPSPVAMTAPVENKADGVVPEKPQATQVTDFYYNQLPNQLKRNEEFELKVPASFSLADSTLLLWSPSLETEIFAEGNALQMKDTFTSDTMAVALVQLKASPDSSEFSLTLTAKSPVEYSQYCRCLVELKGAGDATPFFIHLHSRPTIKGEKRVINPTRYQTELVVPLSRPAVPGNWELSLGKLVPAASGHDLAGSGQSPTFEFKDNRYSCSLNVSPSNVIKWPPADGDDFAWSSPLDEKLIDVEVRMLEPSQGDPSAKVTEVQVALDHSRLDKWISLTITEKLPSVSHSMIPEKCTVPAGIYENLFRSKGGFKEQVEKALHESEKHLDSLEKSKKPASGAADNMGTSTNQPPIDDQITNIKQHLQMLKEASRYFATSIELRKSLSDIRLQELEIHQNCKNGNETKYLPLIVYRDSEAREGQPADGKAGK